MDASRRYHPHYDHGACDEAVEHHDGVGKGKFVAEPHTKLIKLVESVRGRVTIQLARDFGEVRRRLDSTRPTTNHLTDGGGFLKGFQIGNILNHILLNLLTTESIDNVLKERIVDEIPIEVELHKDFVYALSFGDGGKVFFQEGGVLFLDLGWEENERVTKSLQVYLFLFQFRQTCKFESLKSLFEFLNLSGNISITTGVICVITVW